MPIYEFNCSSCGHQFEELIFKQDEVKEIACPECEEKNVNQLLSSFASTSSGKSSGSAARSCAPGSFT